MADIDDNPKDLTLAEAISYLAFDCLLAKEDLAARQEVHSDRSKVQSAMVSEMLDTMLPGEELPKGLKPEEEKKRREELKQEEARKTRLYGGAKLDWIFSLKGDWLAFTPDDAAKIDDACNRLVRWMIDEKVTGSGRLKKDDKLDNERQDIPSGFLRSGVHVNPLADSIDEDILLPGNFGRPLKGYRYVKIDRAELVAAKRAGKQQPDRSSGGYSEDRDEGGRPTYAKEIVEAGLYLLGRNEIDPANPGKSNWHKVREHVQKQVDTDDARGLSDQTIRRHLKPILNAHGKARG